MYYAEQDLRDLQRGGIPVWDVEDVADIGKQACGVLFVPYTKLLRHDHMRTLIKSWCGGPSFAGPLIFDEIHNAHGNAAEVCALGLPPSTRLYAAH